MGAGSPQQDPPNYGRDMMKEQERNEQRWLRAGARASVRLEHHERMLERAKERFVGPCGTAGARGTAFGPA